jgi:hypothetical protein
LWFFVGQLRVWLLKHKDLKAILILQIQWAGDAILSCPKCHSHKNIVCLAGGIVLTQTQQIPFYCLACKQNFLAKKKRLETESHLSFEVIAIDQKVLSPKLSDYKPNSFKRFLAKQKEC